MIPNENKENDKVESIKISDPSVKENPGSMLSLFNKTGDDGEKYDHMRKNKKFTVSSETQQIEDPKRSTKFHPLKFDYDQSSQISTLPITNTLRDECKLPDERKAILGNKQKYDYTSSIHTLPGYRNDRIDDKSPLKKAKEELGKRFVLTTDEANELKGDLKVTSPGVSYKNGLSGSDQNTDKQINPLSKPMKPMEAHNQLLEKSTDEYFCLKNHSKKRPPNSRDLFRSNFEFC